MFAIFSSFYVVLEQELTRSCGFSRVRALGETDLNPVSAIGKISQLVFAVVQPNNVVANLVAGGISEAGAQQSGDLMQDLKTGYLWHASPKAQFQGQVSLFSYRTLLRHVTDQRPVVLLQLVGSLASVFVSTALYCLYRRVYQFPSTSFPVPTAAIWYVVLISDRCEARS